VAPTAFPSTSASPMVPEFPIMVLLLLLLFVPLVIALWKKRSR
jgi:hypothetical protein